MLLEFSFRQKKKKKKKKKHIHDHFVMLKHQTAWLSTGGANNIFEFYGLLKVLTCMTDLCRQSRTSGIKSLQVELPEAHSNPSLFLLLQYSTGQFEA